MPKAIANAAVDRLLHHAHVVLTQGDSVRLTQATAGKGVMPLADWKANNEDESVKGGATRNCPQPGRSY